MVMEPFSSPFLHVIMPGIYFFSKLKPLKPSNQNLPSPWLCSPALICGQLSGTVLQRRGCAECGWPLSCLLLLVPYSIMLLEIISGQEPSYKQSVTVAWRNGVTEGTRASRLVWLPSVALGYDCEAKSQGNHAPSFHQEGDL